MRMAFDDDDWNPYVFIWAGGINISSSYGLYNLRASPLGSLFELSHHKLVKQPYAESSITSDPAT